MPKTKIKKTTPVIQKKLSVKINSSSNLKEASGVSLPTLVEEKLTDVLKDDAKTQQQEDFLIKKELKSKPDRYFEAVGRRKTAVARVRLFTRGEKQFLVNGKSYKEYFTIMDDQQKAVSSMIKMKCLDKFKIIIIVKGGGRSAQAEAVRHGTARVLVDFNKNFKKRLRKVGYLTRDPRTRERKKFGLKRARKAPQWAKR